MNRSHNQRSEKQFTYPAAASIASPLGPIFQAPSAAPRRTPGICKLLQHLWPQEGALQTPCPRLTFPSCGPGGLSERVQVCTQEGKVSGCLKDRAGQGRAGVTRGHQGSLSGPRELCLCVCVSGANYPARRSLPLWPLGQAPVSPCGLLGVTTLPCRGICHRLCVDLYLPQNLQVTD